MKYRWLFFCAHFFSFCSRSQSSERGTGTPPSTPGSCGERAPRSTTKTPRLRQRVFASLERQADKMINLLTPRKVRNSSPGVLKHTKVCGNVCLLLSLESVYRVCWSSIFTGIFRFRFLKFSRYCKFMLWVFCFNFLS